jgi:hypothetical protein
MRTACDALSSGGTNVTKGSLVAKLKRISNELNFCDDAFPFDAFPFSNGKDILGFVNIS